MLSRLAPLGNDRAGVVFQRLWAMRLRASGGFFSK